MSEDRSGDMELEDSSSMEKRLPIPIVRVETTMTSLSESPDTQLNGAAVAAGTPTPTRRSGGRVRHDDGNEYLDLGRGGVNMEWEDWKKKYGVSKTTGKAKRYDTTYKRIVKSMVISLLFFLFWAKIHDSYLNTRQRPMIVVDADAGNKNARRWRSKEKPLSEREIHDLLGDGELLRLKPQVIVPPTKPRFAFFLATELNFKPFKKYLLENQWVQGKLPKQNKQALKQSHLIFVNDVKQFNAARRANPNAMINNLGVKDCMWGSKVTQLDCRQRLAVENGCMLETLHLQPLQYRMNNNFECMAFMERLGDTRRQLWWVRKSGSDYTNKSQGMKLYSPDEARKILMPKYGDCEEDLEDSKESEKHGDLVMEYIANTATVGGHKFDVRTFVLVASAKPFIVFHHQGFGRRALKPYGLETRDKEAHFTNTASQSKSWMHFMDIDTLQKALSYELNFPPDYFVTEFREKTEKIANFVFQAQRFRFTPIERQWQLFGLDWMIQRDGQVFFLESNGFPLVSPLFNKKIPKMQEMWDTMMELVVKVQTGGITVEKSWSEFSVAANYSFHGWRMIFNENEELMTGRLYDPCTIFSPANWDQSKVYKGEFSRKYSKITDVLHATKEAILDLAQGKPFFELSTTTTNNNDNGDDDDADNSLENRKSLEPRSPSEDQYTEETHEALENPEAKGAKLSITGRPRKSNTPAIAKLPENSIAATVAPTPYPSLASIDCVHGNLVSSRLSCQELKWDKNNRNRKSMDLYGRCAASALPSFPSTAKGPKTVCSGSVDFNEAKRFCERAGARLCTLAEVQDLQLAAFTGCKADQRRVWTSTRCKANDTDYYFTTGGSQQPKKLPTRCQHANQKYPYTMARCCADMVPRCLPDDHKEIVSTLPERKRCGSGMTYRGSELTCTELRWKPAKLREDMEQICAANTIDGKCLSSSANSFDVAEAQCRAIGARLCTAVELDEGIIPTLGSLKCVSGDYTHVWTLSKCGNESGEDLRLAMSTSVVEFGLSKESIPDLVCLPRRASAGVRCCADIYGQFCVNTTQFEVLPIAGYVMYDKLQKNISEALFLLENPLLPNEPSLEVLPNKQPIESTEYESVESAMQPRLKPPVHENIDTEKPTPPAESPVLEWNDPETAAPDGKDPHVLAIVPTSTSDIPTNRSAIVNATLLLEETRNTAPPIKSEYEPGPNDESYETTNNIQVVDEGVYVSEEEDDM